MFRLTATTLILLTALVAHAKTPSEVFEQAAKSTVIVRNIDGGGKSKGMGSGVILPDRDVVTNCHVVKGASQLKVRIGKSEYPATLRYSDWDRDVCSLAVPGISAPPVAVGSTRRLKIGARVYAIGAPRGLELTLSDGIVSSLRAVEGGQYIQTTAAISPGSSGGRLFDENGALVGLTTFYLADGQNLNFAVPVEWVKELPKRSTKAASAGQSEAQWLNTAIALQSRKDWRALLDHSRRWTQAQPKSSAAWFGLGITYNTYKELGQTAKAIDAYQQALRIDPENAMAWYNIGVAYKDLGQTAKAIDAYQQSLRIDPEYSDAWSNLGVAFSATDQTAKAIEAFQQALRIDPENARYWFGLGLLYATSGQRGKVLAAYKRLKSLDAALAERLFNLAVMP